MKLDFRRIRKRLLRGGLILLVLFLLGYFAVPWLFPFPQALKAPPTPGAEITDRHGNPLRRLLANGQRSLSSVSISEIPQALINATVAAEDKRFYSHGGIDFISLGRAMRDTVVRRRVSSGASTITQQLVKISNPRPRTILTKVIEMLTARRIEMTWSKDQILEAYLNRIDYGNLRVGCASAAQGYFSKPLRDCSTAQCALLAGLPQAPSRLNPYHHLQRATHRQKYVLSKMEAAGMVSAAEKLRAEKEPLHLTKDYGEFAAPHFVDLVLAAHPSSGGQRTSLDLPLQQFCERTITERLHRLKDNRVGQAACVVIDNASGGVRALVGSRDYSDPAQGQVNGATARRSPGSALKPFVYMLAMQQGGGPATMVDDLPIEFITPNGLYQPKNYSGRTHGPVSYRIALANSLNLAAVRVLQRVGGPESLMQALQSMGITTLTRSPTDYGLGLVIGGGEVTLLELATAYATLARLGVHQPVNLLESTASSAETSRLFDPAACYLLADILSDNEARTRSFGSQSALRLPFPVAVKTGTSTDYRDNWTIGFSPQYTVAVWAGNFDGTRMLGVSGVTGAAPIFREIFNYLHSTMPQTWYPQPENIQRVEVDRLTGLPAPAKWVELRQPWPEKFHRDHLPPPPAPDQYDDQGRVYLPEQFASWLRSRDNWLGDQVALAPAQSTLNAPEKALRIVSPLSGSTFLLDPNLPDGGQILPLRANRPDDQLDWTSETLAISKLADKTTVRMTPGRHEIRVRHTSTGDKHAVQIEVKKL